MTNMQSVRVSISSIVGGGICVAASDGQKVHQEIYNIIKNGDRVILSFSGVSRMTTAFLNAAVGQLYGEFSERTIKRRLAPPIEYEEWHLKRLKIVVDRAKEYFRDTDRIEKLFKENLGDIDG